MTSKNEIRSQKMEIRFSRLYTSQSNKKELETGLTFEMKTERLLTVLRSLSISIPVEREKLEMYAMFTSLGKVEHGDKGLEYINSILPSNIKPITEEELVVHNLYKIFGEKDLPKELIEEYIQIYRDNTPNQSLEILMLKIALELERVTQGITKAVLLNDDSISHTQVGADFKIEEINKIEEIYIKTGKLENTAKVKTLLPKIDTLFANYSLSPECKEELYRYIEDITRYDLSREELLEKIYEFNSKLNKKKIRGR